ncbi:leiomodin-2-like [Diorhabda sublineata]|uniref:leiomodin-2-like n=1 Tax=Diorhabda sublineata TaxID=1163346 RepID=UPI0024E15663|nr:leiomodin-2-like [Diorhabda sublineata]
MSKYSENEDDPDVYESSGEEWKDIEVKKNNRRSSKRLSKKPRKTVVEYGSSEEDSDSEPKKKKSKNGVSKKKVKQEDDEDHEEVEAENEDNEDSDKEKSEKSSQNSESKVASTTATSNSSTRGIHRKFIPKTIYSEEYATGSFVILKKDAQVGDPSKHPCIWRIDGKALLQKYEAFDDDGKVRHKNTSIYTGWSPMDKDLYAPVSVDVVQHNNQNLTVELHWDKLKTINTDSD